MTIYNFRCLYDILHKLEEHSLVWSTLNTQLCIYSGGCRRSQMYIYKSTAVFLKFKIIKYNKYLGRWNFFKAALTIDETIIRNKCVKKQTVPNSKIEVYCKQPQWASLLNTLLIFSVILLILEKKKFCKHEKFLQRIIADMQIKSVIFSLHLIKSSYLLLIVLQLKKGITAFVCMYAVFGYVHFLTATTYFRRLHTTSSGYILLSTAVQYFRQLYHNFDAIYSLQFYLAVTL